MGVMGWDGMGGVTLFTLAQQLQEQLESRRIAADQLLAGKAGKIRFSVSVSVLVARQAGQG